MLNTTPKIPDYEMLRCIGRGSYGEVWLGKSVTGNYRAIKVVYRSSFDHQRPYDREFAGIQRFEPVSRTHETQVDILHVGRNEPGEYFYYVMELADDQMSAQAIDPENYLPRTLRSDQQRQPGGLGLRVCLEIALQLTAALEHLHKNRLVHRDIKPSNIVFVGGVPKLADIGLVTSSDASRSFVGTEGYIPPEGPGTLQADIYSFGKVLYEISTGRNRLDFPELPTTLKDSPDKDGLMQLNQVVLKACEENPKSRYQSAADMGADLALLKSGKPLRHSRLRLKPKALMIIALVGGLIALGPFLGPKKLRPSNRPAGAGTNAAAELTRPTAVQSLEQATLGKPAGLVAWWTGAGTALDSAGTNHGILRNGAGFASNHLGQAFSFDGAYQYLEVPFSPSLGFNMTNPMSVALWAYRTGLASTMHLIGKRTTCAGIGAECNYQLAFNEGSGEGLVFNGGSGEAASRRVLPLNQWTHLAGTYDGTLLHLYIDGNFTLASAGNLGPANAAPLKIGNSSDCAGFAGLIKDVRIYNRPLSPAEVSEIFKSGQ